MKRLIYILILGLATTLMLFVSVYYHKSTQETTQPNFMVILENQSQFSYDEFIEDSETKEIILNVVMKYVGKGVKVNGYLVFRGDLSNRKRQFKVIEVFDVVSRKNKIYTVQVDVDEIEGEPRYLLFFDVQKTDKGFELTRVRLGGRHLRQTSV